MSERAGSSWSMADISAKPVSRRVALAAGSIVIGQEAMQLLLEGRLPKGDPLAMAEIAGMLAAKQTPALIPLCHPIELNRVAVRAFPDSGRAAVDVYCITEIFAKTGVEMEALTGLNVALLAIWDLVKPVNPALQISGVRLLYKSGGKRGTWLHPDGCPAAGEELIRSFG